MFGEYAQIASYLQTNRDSYIAGGDFFAANLPSHLIPTHPRLSSPWGGQLPGGHRSQATGSRGDRPPVEDFIMVAEFSEIEGPKPVLTIPKDAGGNVDQNALSVKIMAVDHQTSSEGFSISEDTQVVLSDDDVGVSAFVHHFVLYDNQARGFVRPYCMVFVTTDLRKIMNFYEELSSQFKRAARFLKYGNRLLFVQDLERHLQDLEHTKEYQLTQVARMRLKDLGPQNNGEESKTRTNTENELYKQLQSIRQSSTEIKEILSILKPLLHDRRLESRFRALEERAYQHERQALRVQAEQRSLQGDGSSDKIYRYGGGIDTDGSYKETEVSPVSLFKPVTSHTPVLVETKKAKRFNSPLRGLHELCSWGAKEGLRKLRCIQEYFRKDSMVLEVERNESRLMEPANSMIIHGQCITSNFLASISLREPFWCISEDSSSLLQAAEKMQRWPSIASNDTLESFKSVESYLSLQDEENASLLSFCSNNSSPGMTTSNSGQDYLSAPTSPLTEEVAPFPPPGAAQASNKLPHSSSSHTDIPSTDVINRQDAPSTDTITSQEASYSSMDTQQDASGTTVNSQQDPSSSTVNNQQDPSSSTSSDTRQDVSNPNENTQQDTSDSGVDTQLDTSGSSITTQRDVPGSTTDVGQETPRFYIDTMQDVPASHGDVSQAYRGSHSSEVQHTVLSSADTEPDTNKQTFPGVINGEAKDAVAGSLQTETKIVTISGRQRQVEKQKSEEIEEFASLSLKSEIPARQGISTNGRSPLSVPLMMTAPAQRIRDADRGQRLLDETRNDTRTEVTKRPDSFSDLQGYLEETKDMERLKLEFSESFASIGDAVSEISEAWCELENGSNVDGPGLVLTPSTPSSCERCMWKPRHGIYTAGDVVNALGPGRPGYGIFEVMGNYSNLQSVLLSLMTGRTVLVLGPARMEMEVTQVVTALSIFLSDTKRKHHSVVDWMNRPLKVTDLTRICLAGVCRSEKRSLDATVPNAVKQYSTILDVERRVLYGPPYQGTLLHSVLQQKKSFHTDAQYVAYIHSWLMEISTKAFIFYHSFCLGEAGGLTHSHSLERHREHYNSTVSSLMNRLGVRDNDIQIVECMAEKIKLSQLEPHMWAGVDKGSIVHPLTIPSRMIETFRC